MATVLDQARCRCRIPKCADPVICFIRWWNHSRDEYRWETSCYQHVPWGANVQVVYAAWVELRSADHDSTATADHPGHVHVHYADGVSADHPTNI